MATKKHEPLASSRDGQTIPEAKSFSDFRIIISSDGKKGHLLHVYFYLITTDDVVYVGKSYQPWGTLTLAECNAALERIDDDYLYPRVPSHVNLTIAPDDLPMTFMKRVALTRYGDAREWGELGGFVPDNLLLETLNMETISNSPHPNIIHYHGCRVRRGRIIAIFLERLDQTLDQFVSTPEFEQLDKETFCKEVESAVQHVHGLGLAHNDISPYNIMLKEGRPVLIDFGSCAAFGQKIRSLGTPGWYEGDWRTSETAHDSFSLRRLREWIQNPKMKLEGK